MTESILIQKKWLPLASFDGLPLLILDKLILTCSSLLILKIYETPSKNNGLQLLCINKNEQSLAEFILNQALSDERLREEIHLKSDLKIDEFVQNILAHSLSK